MANGIGSIGNKIEQALPFLGLGLGIASLFGEPHHRVAAGGIMQGMGQFIDQRSALKRRQFEDEQYKSVLDEAQKNLDLEEKESKLFSRIAKSGLGGMGYQQAAMQLGALNPQRYGPAALQSMRPQAQAQPKISARARMAAEQGFQPGTPQWKSFMMHGGPSPDPLGPKTEAERAKQRLLQYQMKVNNRQELTQEDRYNIANAVSTLEAPTMRNVRGVGLVEVPGEGVPSVFSSLAGTSNAFNKEASVAIQDPAKRALRHSYSHLGTQINDIRELLVEASESGETITGLAGAMKRWLGGGARGLMEILGASPGQARGLISTKSDELATQLGMLKFSIMPIITTQRSNGISNRDMERMDQILSDNWSSDTAKLMDQLDHAFNYIEQVESGLQPLTKEPEENLPGSIDESLIETWMKKYDMSREDIMLEIEKEMKNAAQ